jgi:hypothetical protein
MRALEQAEKLQRHGDHEESGGNRQKSLASVEQAVQHQHLPQRTGDRTQEAVSRQPTRIVEQVTSEGRSMPAWIVAERTSETAAHPDAMKAACETGGKYHQIVGHWQLPDQSPTRCREALARRRYQRSSQSTQTKKAVWAIAPPIKAIVWYTSAVANEKAVCSSTRLSCSAEIGQIHVDGQRRE